MMKQLIKRQSLVTQVVEALKQEFPLFVRGKWLPGERELSRQFYACRTMVRAALAQMQSQELIRAYPQQGYRILVPLPDPCHVVYIINLKKVFFFKTIRGHLICQPARSIAIFLSEAMDERNRK